MKKFNPNKNIIIGLILAIIVVAVVSITAQRRASGEQVTPVGMATNETVGFVDRVVGAPGRFVSDIVNMAQDLMNTYEENVQLKQKLDSYDQLVLDNKNQAQQIAQLKEELNLQTTLASFEKTTANVITRSPDTWQDTLVIDKGSNDGIAVNMTVM
ncbi:MAG: rod shape-determining protein MreC, partial [Streptococcaceae bacterium]|nr:rod shape-determining protein MreC [Streptococcaceae bacterium]